MKRLPNKTCFLIADGARALLLRNDGDALLPDLKLVRAYGQDNPATRDQGSDRPGRSNDSFGRRYAYETTDWHQIAEDRFVERIAEDMAKDLADGEFDKLVVAASPVALGEFRKAASGALVEATILEIDKDLTKHPLVDIEKIIVKALNEAGFKF